MTRPTAPKSLEGACLCGRVRFAVERPLPNLYRCHCSLCRRQGGGAGNAATIVSLERFRWLDGEAAVVRWRRPTGFSSHFCSTCGSPVPNPVQTTPWMWIPAGLLDDVDDARVVAHLCVDDRAAWDRAEEADVVKFDGCPDIDPLVALLRREA